MLGAMLDIDDSVRLIMDWIEENGGYEKNALVRIRIQYVKKVLGYANTGIDDFLTTMNLFFSRPIPVRDSGS